MPQDLRLAYDGTSLELHEYVVQVNNIISKIDHILDPLYGFSGSYNPMIALRLIHHHILEDHFCKKDREFHGFSVSCNPDRRRLWIICSCGERFPMHEGERSLKLMGQTFDEFLSGMNWAYDFIVNKTDNAFKGHHVEKSEIGLEIKLLKYDNPVSSLEL